MTIENSYNVENRVRQFLGMTVNHSTMSESVPRVPFFRISKEAGPSGTNIGTMLHRWDKSPGG